MTIELKAKSRTESGKGIKALRNAGFLPAVLYGQGVPSRSIAIPYKDFEKVYRATGESTLLTLEVDGKSYNVLIHDIAHDPLRDTPIHADFYAVRMDKMIRIKVPIEFEGESPAVKNEGGVLVKVVHELEVEALPADLPSVLRAELNQLTSLGDRLMVRDIFLPKGVRILAHSEEVIAVVERPRTDEELAALSETPGAEVPIQEVKTEQELKREKEVKVDKEAPASA